MLQYIQSHLFEGVEALLSLIGGLYAIFKIAIYFKNSQFKIDLKITERSDLNDDNNKPYGTLVRMQIINLSLNKLIISEIDLFETSKELFLPSDKYSHFVKMMKYKDFKHPIFTSDFPIDIPGKSSKSVTLLFTSNSTENKVLENPQIRLFTTQGTKIVKASYIEPSKNVDWFS